MTASRILVATEAHVLMGWLPSHVCVSQATLDYTVRRVSSGFIIYFIIIVLVYSLDYLVLH